jgi:AcrR family transcriptional regulator
MRVSSRSKKRVRKAPEPRPGPPGGKRDGKRDQNRKAKTKQLLDAGLVLFLRRGVESVTIDEIVEEAKIAKGSFYRYFDDKAALVAALFEPMRARMAEAFATSDREIQAATTSETLNAAYVHIGELIGVALLEAPDVARLYLQECRSPATGTRAPIREMADWIDDQAEHLTRVAHDRGLLRPFEGRVSCRVVVGAVEKLVFAVLSGKDLGNPLEIPGALITMVMDGLKPTSSS